MSSLSFEWDERKNASNLEKHGVSFDEARIVFADELGRLIPDPDHYRRRRAFYPYGNELQAQDLNSLPLRKKLKYYSYYFG